MLSDEKERGSATRELKIIIRISKGFQGVMEKDSTWFHPSDDLLRRGLK